MFAYAPSSTSVRRWRNQWTIIWTGPCDAVEGRTSVVDARFDDLRAGHATSFRLDGLIETFGASTVAGVATALDRAEDAVAAGRWVAGWVGYEAAPAFDDAFVVRPVAGTPLADLPLVWFAVFERRPSRRESLRANRWGRGSVAGWTPTIDAARYRADIAAVHARIRAGDTYQVNHTFRLRAPFDGDAGRLYGRLVRAQRAGYGAYLAAGRWTVASASPEVFFEWSGDEIRCRPMKGTARRGLDAATDARRREALLASAKDRAENLMIVDMIRNDLGRIAVPGTVGVPSLFTAEKYDAWQLTSTVTARVRPRTRLRDVFGALFPCASITGCAAGVHHGDHRRVGDHPARGLLRCDRLRRSRPGRASLGVQRRDPHRAGRHPRGHGLVRHRRRRDDRLRGVR